MSYNRAYHGYFEGYIERQVIDSSGRMKIERVYAGDYYHHKLDDKRWKRLKLQYGLAYLWALLTMLVLGITGNGTQQWYVGIPVMLCVLAMLWLGYCLGCYILNPRDMMISQYRGRKHVVSLAMVSAIGIGLVIVGKIVWMALNRSISGIVGVIMGLTGIVACGWIFHAEQDMEYVKRANDAPIPKDGYDIRFNEDD